MVLLFMLVAPTSRSATAGAAPSKPTSLARKLSFHAALIVVGLVTCEGLLAVGAGRLPAFVWRLGFIRPRDGPALLGESYFDKYYDEAFDPELAARGERVLHAVTRRGRARW